jgi:hypothetical protein
MATQAQISANRVNSQKSTGPRTAEGMAAMSQNAFKHGLFVDKAVIRDESQDEYDLRREAALAELRPVGEMESIVAERFVNLSWRLKRAERMQNQSIDYLGMDELVSWRVEEFREKYRKANGLSHDDPAIAKDHLLLGRIATDDWCNCKVLDKMLLYERRIENSMYRALNELKKLQDARKKAERADAAERQSAEESPPARRHKGDLKKQSQFAPALMGTTSYVRKDYDDIPRLGAAENKANQSQFHKPASGEGARKSACRKVAHG